jgi:cytochrome c553
MTASTECEGTIMKLIKLTIAVLTIAASCVFSFGSHAQSCKMLISRPSSPLDGEKLAERNCAWCHGPSLQGFAVAPRLAGQHPEYIRIQLERLNNLTRDNPFALKYMSHVAAKVNAEAGCELAYYLASIPPEPASDGEERLADEGRVLFEQGDPARAVPACAFCHGPNAQGAGIFPRLGGQSFYYLQRRLQQWGEGYSAVSPHMPGIAKKLSEQEINALASYLSFVW